MRQAKGERWRCIVSEAERQRVCVCERERERERERVSMLKMICTRKAMSVDLPSNPGSRKTETSRELPGASSTATRQLSLSKTHQARMPGKHRQGHFV